MNWSKDKSILLSRVCVIVFAALLLALDVGCYWLFTGYVVHLRGDPWQYALLLMISFYLASVLGWLTLWQLWRLLGNIRQGRVFVPENVRAMRAVSWCCAGAAVICLIDALWYLPYLFAVVAVAAGFMALIVRIVKNVFQQAISMKSELDLTI